MAVNDDGTTEGVKTLLGNPKKAVLAMAVPLIIAMIAQSANNLIDAVWVAGLGADALAAVGFVFPLFFVIIGVGNGVGVGTSSAIARRIGAGNKAGADRTAMQGIGLMIGGGILASVFLLVFQRPILMAMGAGGTIDECIGYGTPIYLCAVILLVNVLFTNLLRSEGAAKRSMLTQILSEVINIILDPLFIYDYGLGMGVAGAAWATVIATIIPLIIMMYWYFVKKDTYIQLSRKNLDVDKPIAKEILHVGIPASIEFIAISIFSMLMNMVVVMCGGTDNVAIFSSAWKVIQILMIPLMAIGGAIVPVFAAAYGAKRFDKIKDAYGFALRFCIAIMFAIVIVTELTAPVMAIAFTYTDSTAYLRDPLVQCLRVLCLFLPFASWGFVATGLFQSMGMGMKSLACTLFRSGLQVPVCYFLAITVGTFYSVQWGVFSTELIGSVFAGVWSLLLMRGLLKGYAPPKDGTFDGLQ